MGILATGLLILHRSHTLLEYQYGNFENHAFRPTHASGHTLDLVLSPSDSGVDDLSLSVIPISSNISDHMVFFCVNFPKTYAFTKSITFKKYQSS